jgi:hypothetical protein
MDADNDAVVSQGQKECPDSALQKFFTDIGGMKSIFLVWGVRGEDFFESVLSFVKSTRSTCCGKTPKLNLVLHSRGGDPHLAYKAANVLRDSFGGITVWVPHFAKSGATLLCFAGNEIVLGLGADLGPLDTQIVDPEDPENMISALEITEAPKAATEFLYKEFYVIIDALRHPGSGLELTRSDLLDLVMEFLKLFGLPLFKQIRLTSLNACLRALEITRKYGIELLVRSGIKKERARNAIDMLVRQYPCHAFVIDAPEAAKIDLPVAVREANLDEQPALDELSIIVERFLQQCGGKEYFGPLVSCDNQT